FIRKGADPDDFLLVVCNFTPIPRKMYRIGVPQPGFYNELINTDARIYGGTDVGNAGGVYSEAIPCHAREHSIQLTLPPLGMLVLKPVRKSPRNGDARSSAPARS